MSNFKPASSGGAKVSHGTYAGNNVENRAIAHGLGAIPKLVIINSSGADLWIAVSDTDWLYNVKASSTSGQTTKTTTNFYVGNSGGYPASANAAGTDYFWTAFY